RAARELFAGGLAGVPLTVYGGGAAISQRLPDDLPGVDAGAEGAYALVGFLGELEEHADLVAGAWPRAVEEDEPAQAALPREVAEDLGLSVGDRVTIVDEVRDLDRPVVVTGVWEARDPSQAYWALLGGISTGTGQVWGPFVVHPDEYLARYQRLGTLEWIAVADPGDLARAGMPEGAAAVGDLRDLLRRLRDQPDSPLDEAARLRTGLDDLAERLTVATVVNRSGLVLPAALLGVIAAYGLVLVARLLVAHRRGENALLRARGASRRQLVRLAAAEAALAVGPAALLGA